MRNSSVSDKPMTMDEKTKLKTDIGEITGEQQKGIISLVQECINQSNGDVFEFELD